MSARAEDFRRTWIAAGAGAAIVVAGVGFFFSLAAPRGPELAPGAPASPRLVELARTTTENSLLAEEAAMRDLTPLFLPTPRNVMPREPAVREPGDRFLDVQAPQYLFTPAAPPIAQALPPAVTMNGKPVAAARPMDVFGADAPPIGLFGLGRGEARVVTVPERGAAIEVTALATGQRVPMAPLPPEARPPTDHAWQPLEFLIVVDPAGLVERPTLVTGSRLPEVDQHFQNYLVRRLQIGERLAPGFYRITIGP